jgi:uncharacterized membrane protein
MKAFIEQQLDSKRIEHAIAAAELKTSGELRVVIHRAAVADPVATAREEFTRLEMFRTRERNAVLILVAPASRNFAIFGDEAIHAKCGQPFWDEVAAAMTGYFREGKFTDGLVHAIDHAGRFLAKHFPRRPDDKNELPDNVVDRGTVI